MFAQATFTDPGYYPRGKWALGLCIFEFYRQYQLVSAINLDQSLFNISDSDKHNVVHGNHLFQSVYWSVALNENRGGLGQKLDSFFLRVESLLLQNEDITLFAQDLVC